MWWSGWDLIEWIMCRNTTNKWTGEIKQVFSPVFNFLHQMKIRLYNFLQLYFTYLNVNREHFHHTHTHAVRIEFFSIPFPTSFDTLSDFVYL